MFYIYAGINLLTALKIKEESIHSRLQVLSDSMERNLETRFYSIITYLSVLGIPEYYAMFLTIRLVKCIHYCI